MYIRDNVHSGQVFFGKMSIMEGAFGGDVQDPIKPVYAECATYWQTGYILSTIACL